MDVCSAFPADAESSEAVQSGEGPLDYPPVDAKSRAVAGVSASDGWDDTAGTDLVAVDVVVVAAVGEQRVRPAPWTADPAADGRDGVQLWHQLGDVVSIAAGEDDGERGAVAVGDQVMLGACPAPVDRRRARVDPPFRALTWEESTTQRDQSRRAAAFSWASRTSCSRCQTPASFQSRSRRQHVMPEPKPSSLGRCSHWMSVCSTYKIPHSTCRSGTGRRPGYRKRRSLLGSSGSIRSQRSSGTIHGEVPTERTTPNPPVRHGHQDRCTSLC